LHSLGYVHRDLKPENIVLNLDPLEVRIIDFNIALLDSETSTMCVRGTPGYTPENADWAMGSYKWDLWAFAAIICEADMPRDAYMSLNKEATCLKAIEKHINLKTTDERLKYLMKETVFKKKKDAMIDSESIKNELMRIKF